MLIALIFLLACGLGTHQPANGGQPPLTDRRHIALPGVAGRIDHMACDPGGKRLFVAALGNGSLEVIDLEKGERVKSIDGLKEPQGIAYLPATGRVVVACGGDGTVRSYDASTLEQVGMVALGDDADNVRVDGGHILVGYGDRAIAILDAESLEKTGDIAVSGHPEAFEPEAGGGRVFVNVPGGFIGGGGDVEVGDRAAGAAGTRWKLDEAGRNFPMALDGAGKRLFVGCRRPARLAVIDTGTGKVIASPECVGDADEVFVDARTGRVMVIGGDGAIDVFESADHQAYTRVASVKTADGARTGLFVAESGTLFVAVPRRSGHEAEIREYSVPAEITPIPGSKP